MRKTINAYNIGIAFLFLNLIGIHAQNSSPEKPTALCFEASYIGDLVNNFAGGIKKGTTYLGLANIKADLNTQNANWWKGGEAFINIGNTHGGEPSANLVGDFQGVSNIEAGNLTFLYELWYKQTINKLDITVGLQDLNANFATSKNGALFTNSSFGIQSSIADNISLPIYPLTALGANVQWSISSSIVSKIAIFDGTPDDYRSNPFNTHWRLNKNDGFLGVMEFEINKSIIKNKQGSYKFGIYYHQHNDTIDVEQKNGGLYFVGDQEITKKLSLFSQIGLSPKSINNHNHYYSIGANYKGLINGRPHDLCGLAVAYAGIDGNTIGSETAIEFTYQLNINNNIYLRPDIQYIINPAGTDIKLNNALVGFVRLGVQF